MILLFFVNAAVILNAYFITKVFFRSKSFSGFIISWFIIFYAQIVLILQTLGIFGKLYPHNVVISSLLFLAVGFAMRRSYPLGKEVKLSWPIFEYISGINKIERLAFSVIIGFVVVKLLINLFNPPFGWDNLNYHFTFPVEWLKNGNLKCPISIAGDPSVSYYPINGSLFYFWFMFPLRNVFLADLGQFPFFVCAFLAAYSIGRKSGVSSGYALLAASLFSIIPNYFKQLQIAYVDIMDAALFLISLDFLLAAKQVRSRRALFLSALSAGLLLGTKTTAMPLVLLLSVGILLVILLSFRRKAFPALIISAGAILLFGGFSYARNLITTGNPLYPLNFKVFNLTIFKGVIDNAIYRTGILPGDFGLRRLLFSEGLGAQTLLFVFPVILLSPILVFWKIEKDDSSGLGYLKKYLFILPIAIFLVFRFVLPLPNVRYVYCLLATSLIIAFYILEKLSVPRKVVLGVVFVCILASAGEMSKKLELVVSLVFSLVVYLLFPYIINVFRLRLLRKAFILITAILIFLFFSNRIYVKNEYPRYLKMVKYSGFWPDATIAWDWLNQNTYGNNIAYTGRPTQFPLYGANFKNDVYYVSVNQIEPAKLHYYPGSKYVWGYKNDLWFNNFEEKNNYRGNPNYDVWLENLERNKIDFLFVYSGLSAEGIEFPIEDNWAKSHVDRFKLVFNNDTIHIYKLAK